MAYSENPPFDRGTTYFGGGTVSATEGEHLCGKKFEFVDQTHKPGSVVTCMVVRAKAAITVARVGVEFDTDAGEYDHLVNAICDTAGAYGWPIDDKLVVGSTIPANDLFYLVVDGPCQMLTSATSSNEAADLVAGGPVTMNGSGKLDGSPSANNHVIGYCDATSTTTNTLVIVWVTGPGQNEY